MDPNPQSSNPQILKSSDPQILRSSDPQILRSSNPQLEEIADRINRQVGWRIRTDLRRIVCVMALPDEDRRHPVAPYRLDGGEDPELVVDHHVPPGRIAALDI